MDSATASGTTLDSVSKTPANPLAAVGRVLARLWCAGDTWKEGV
ncbi:MAG TPA: hypothetical protein VGJ30_02740 [Candidatus Angelobacter sp.]